MSERVERVLGREREGAAAWAGREVGAAALGDARVGGRLAPLAWARDPAPDAPGAPAAHQARPSTEKESQQWRTSLAAVGVARPADPGTHAVGVARPADPGTHIVCVGDREADVDALFG